MTWALCLNCGDLKFGAICPCPSCQVASSGNMELDIAFSDHYVDESSLRELGALLQQIREAAAEEEEPAAVTFWTFMRYISEHQSEVLQATVPREYAQRVGEIYESLTIPEIHLMPGHRNVDVEDEEDGESGLES